MKTWMTLGMMAVSAAAWAQTGAPAPAAPAAPTAPTAAQNNTVVLSRSQTITAAVAAMAKPANATVVVDPALTGAVTNATARLPLEQGLSAIAQQYHAQWRKAYLKENEIPRTADRAIDAVRLRQIVETAASVPNVSVGVLDPATGMIAMSTRAAANAPSTQEWLQARKPIYILYRPAIVSSAIGSSAGDMVADYVATQRNSIEAYRKMTPEQRTEAARQGLEMFLDMDPQAMAQMAQQSMQALQNLTTEQKAKLMDMSMKMMGNMNNNTPPAQ